MQSLVIYLLLICACQHLRLSCLCWSCFSMMLCSSSARPRRGRPNISSYYFCLKVSLFCWLHVSAGALSYRKILSYLKKKKLSKVCVKPGGFTRPSFVSQLFHVLFFLTTVVTCPEIDAPLNGKIFGRQQTYKAVVSFACNTGFILSGSERRVCQAHGNWSGEETGCSGDFLVIY